ncbi:MAG: hypothetical protein ACPGOV_10730 [Magnetovibrionaceae bacterium]
MALRMLQSLRRRMVWSQETPIDADLGEHWLLQFTQAAGPLDRIAKRGLNATPMVRAKYDIPPNGYVVLTSIEGRHRACCVFHFGPDVPDQQRRQIMESDECGLEALRDHQADSETAFSTVSDKALEAGARLGSNLKSAGERRVSGRLGQAAATVVGFLGIGMR